jgi:hypothetical protein
MSDQLVITLFFLLPLVLGGLFFLRRAYQYLYDTEWSQKQFSRQNKKVSPDQEKSRRIGMAMVYGMYGTGFLVAGLAGLFLIARSL